MIVKTGAGESRVGIQRKSVTSPITRTSHAGYRNAKTPMHTIVKEGGAKTAARRPVIARTKRMLF
jgi:hypothetical protein